MVDDDSKTPMQMLNQFQPNTLLSMVSAYALKNKKKDEEKLRKHMHEYLKACAKDRKKQQKKLEQKEKKEKKEKIKKEKKEKKEKEKEKKAEKAKKKLKERSPSPSSSSSSSSSEAEAQLGDQRKSRKREPERSVSRERSTERKRHKSEERSNHGVERSHKKDEDKVISEHLEKGKEETASHTKESKDERNMCNIENAPKSSAPGNSLYLQNKLQLEKEIKELELRNQALQKLMLLKKNRKAVAYHVPVKTVSGGEEKTGATTSNTTSGNGTNKDTTSSTQQPNSNSSSNSGNNGDSNGGSGGDGDEEKNNNKNPSGHAVDTKQVEKPKKEEKKSEEIDTTTKPTTTESTTTPTTTTSTDKPTDKPTDTTATPPAGATPDKQAQVGEKRSVDPNKEAIVKKIKVTKGNDTLEIDMEVHRPIPKETKRVKLDRSKIISK